MVVDGLLGKPPIFLIMRHTQVLLADLRRERQPQCSMLVSERGTGEAHKCHGKFRGTFPMHARYSHIHAWYSHASLVPPATSHLPNARAAHPCPCAGASLTPLVFLAHPHRLRRGKQAWPARGRGVTTPAQSADVASDRSG